MSIYEAAFNVKTGNLKYLHKISLIFIIEDKQKKRGRKAKEKQKSKSTGLLIQFLPLPLSGLQIWTDTLLKYFSGVIKGMYSVPPQNKWTEFKATWYLSL